MKRTVERRSFVKLRAAAAAIAYRHIGPGTPRVLDEIVLPPVRGLRAGS